MIDDEGRGGRSLRTNSNIVNISNSELVGFLKDNDSIKDDFTGESLFSKKTPGFKENSKSGGYYEISKFLFDKNNICSAKTSDDKIIVERELKDGTTVLACLDTNNMDLYTAKIEPGSSSLKQLENKEEFQAALIPALISYERDENRQFDNKILDLQKIKTTGDKNSVDNMSKGELADLIRLTGEAGRLLYDNFFRKESNIKLNTINYELPKDFLDAQDSHFEFGNKDFTFFRNIGAKRAVESDIRNVEELLHFYGDHLSPEKKEKIIEQARIENIRISPSIIEYCREFSHTKKRNDMVKQANPYYTPIPTGYYVVGPSGTGKTYDFEMAARLMGKDLVSITVEPDATTQSYFYKTELRNGETVRMPSPALKALIDGDKWLLLDEVNNVYSPDLFDVFNKALANGNITDPVTNETLQISSEVKIAFIGNLGHRGTKDLDSALKSRLREVVYKPLTGAELYDMAVSKFIPDKLYQDNTRLGKLRNIFKDKNPNLDLEKTFKKYLLEVTKCCGKFNALIEQDALENPSRSSISPVDVISYRHLSDFVSDFLGRLDKFINLGITPVEKFTETDIGEIVYNLCTNEDISPFKNPENPDAFQDFQTQIQNSPLYNVHMNASRKSSRGSR